VDIILRSTGAGIPMNMIDVLSTSAELRRTAEFARWMSALRLIGAGLVALGVVFEFIGELAGRQSERQLEMFHDVQIRQLADRVETLRDSVALTHRASSYLQSSALKPNRHPGKLGESPSCPRAKQSTAL
jgi:hypothetical protein